MNATGPPTVVRWDARGVGACRMAPSSRSVAVAIAEAVSPCHIMRTVITRHAARQNRTTSNPFSRFAGDDDEEACPVTAAMPPVKTTSLLLLYSASLGADFSVENLNRMISL